MGKKSLGKIVCNEVCSYLRVLCSLWCNICKWSGIKQLHMFCQSRLPPKQALSNRNAGCFVQNVENEYENCIHTKTSPRTNSLMEYAAGEIWTLLKRWKFSFFRSAHLLLWRKINLDINLGNQISVRFPYFCKSLWNW